MPLALQIGLVLAAGLLCGLVTGAASAKASGPGRGWALPLAGLAALLVAAGLGLPALGLVAGRPGLWLEGAAVLLALYLGGCAIGCAARRALR